MEIFEGEKELLLKMLSNSGDWNSCYKNKGLFLKLLLSLKKKIVKNLCCIFR